MTAAQSGPDRQAARTRRTGAVRPRLRRGDAAIAVLLPACGAALAWAGWLITRSGRNGAALPWHSYSELLGLAAAAAGLAVLAWCGLGLLLAVAASVLHRLGHARLAAVSFAASPAFLRRLVVAVLGLHLLAAPASHASVPAAGSGAAVPAADPSVPDGRPADPYFAVPDRSGAGHTGGVVDPSWQPRSPAPSPGLLAGHAPDAGRQSGPGTVTVRTGDTLWGIAARDLGSLATDAEIARHWPRWYAGNRGTIGADPAQLLPGQILTPPSKG
ncbi:LysM peptidoglycan-binding domain-containing protein [Arthrobacter sp. I2-34]|uniref:LysM peptidoglycan-binding domain-containing protein n=1 Tax=Arthrobacter hankyongi TaxID=2904801 RepID=A0ABS9L7T5_9MICC|nr:LysM domain-containing protein [Arthrobacter hankyongi]MCG2622729.1 LysM peptidoglycan-binding domain-containing protein [Arthrobacter hankyongi]